jgi:DNA polymerase elongation subunit (family B)
MSGEEREAGHVAHKEEQKIINIFVRDLSREREREKKRV